jgi:hypothetical protein
MSTHGGTREGAGRKPKSDEIKLIEALSPLDEVAFNKLKEGVESGSFYHLKLFYEYRYGKPKQLIGVVTENETLEQIFKIGGVEIKL